jgi:hypothetical protein
VRGLSCAAIDYVRLRVLQRAAIGEIRRGRDCAIAAEAGGGHLSGLLALGFRWLVQDTAETTLVRRVKSLRCLQERVRRSAVRFMPMCASGIARHGGLSERLILLKGRELAVIVPACDAGPAIRTHTAMRTIRS